MLIIGLTGSIATGKSTVAALLSSPPHNLPLIDADLLARDAVRPGTRAYQAIVDYFGPSTPDLLLPPDSSPSTSPTTITTTTTTPPHSHPGPPRPLNRPALGRRVFGPSPTTTRDRHVLNAIVHPRVRLLLLRALLAHHLRGAPAVVVDVPLLFESRLDLFCGAVVVVAVRDPRLQMARLRARDPELGEDGARRRVESQMPGGEKVGRCLERNCGWGLGVGGGGGWVVWNDGDRAELAREVDDVVAGLGRWAGGRVWAWWLWGSPLVAMACALWAVLGAWRARRRWEDRESRREKAL